MQAQIWGPAAGLQISGYKPACRRCRALPAPFGGLTLRKAKAAAWSLRQQGSVPGHYPDPVKEALASAWGILFCTHLLIAFAAFLFASFSFLVKRKRSGGRGDAPDWPQGRARETPCPAPWRDSFLVIERGLSRRPWQPPAPCSTAPRRPGTPPGSWASPGASRP